MSSAAATAAAAQPVASLLPNITAVMALDLHALDHLQQAFLGLNDVIHPMLHLVTMCHGFNTAMRLQRLNPNIRNVPLLQCFIAFMVGTIGGGTSCGVLLGVPPRTFGMMNISTLFAVWTLMFVVPGNPVGLLLTHLLPLRAAVVALANVSTAYCVFAGVNASLAQEANEWMLAIFCGVLTATGGGIISDLLSLHSHQWKFGVPDVLRSPSRRLALPFACSALYVATKAPSVSVLVASLGSKEALTAWALLSRFVHIFIGTIVLLNGTTAMFARAAPAHKKASPLRKAKKQH